MEDETGGGKRGGKRRGKRPNAHRGRKRKRKRWRWMEEGKYTREMALQRAKVNDAETQMDEQRE